MRRTIIALGATLGIVAASIVPARADAASPTGDLNGDCIVNSNDLRLIADRYGATYGSLRYVRAWDFNHDGRIGVADVQAVAWQYGDTCV